MKPAPASSIYVAPVAAALKNIQFRLAREESFSFLVAAPTIRELKRQGLPPHVRVKTNQRRGKRVTTRGRRYYYEAHRQTAHWPEDALLESALFTMACVIRGRADFRIADYTLHCRTGDIVLFPPGIPRNDGSRGHFADERTEEIGEILWMDAQATGAGGLRCWICRSEGAKHWSGRELGSCWIPHRFSAKLFEGLCEEAQNGRERAIVIPLLSDLIALLRDEIERGRALDEWGRCRYYGKNDQDAFVAEVLAYVQENIALSLTITDVARHMAVSPATFTRHFKNQTGETFQQYQTKLRLQLAEEMLLHSQAPIRLICSRIGLQYGRFWAVFQERYGCSPTEFRNRKIDRKQDASSGK